MDDRMTPSGGDGPATKRPRTQGQEGHDNRVTDIESNTEHQQDEAQQHERNGDQTGQEAEPGPQLGKDLDNMTETVKAGVFMIQSRTQAADAKIDELIQVGEQVFEELKQQFTQKMQGIKLELQGYYQTHTREWVATSNATIEAAERLQHARQLVQGLGLQAISN